MRTVPCILYTSSMGNFAPSGPGVRALEEMKLKRTDSGHTSKFDYVNNRSPPPHAGVCA